MDDLLDDILFGEDRESAEQEVEDYHNSQDAENNEYNGY